MREREREAYTHPCNVYAYILKYLKPAPFAVSYSAVNANHIALLSFFTLTAADWLIILNSVSLLGAMPLLTLRISNDNLHIIFKFFSENLEIILFLLLKFYYYHLLHIYNHLLIQVLPIFLIADYSFTYRSGFKLSLNNRIFYQFTVVFKGRQHQHLLERYKVQHPEPQFETWEWKKTFTNISKYICFSS